MTVRVGFDMDGVLADFAKAYQEVEASNYWMGHATASEPARRTLRHADEIERYHGTSHEPTHLDRS